MGKKFKFVKANKSQARLRLALFGTSGSGKTYTSLSLATGIQEAITEGQAGGNQEKPRIALIDSERKTASKLADHFDFLTVNLDQRSIPEYLEAIKAAKEAGIEILILDSISHAWKWLVKEVDSIAKAKYRGNTFAAWREGDLLQDEFIDAILDYPGHVIATMRSRTEWTIKKDGDKNAPQRVGLAPDQGKDIEYEFDMLMEFGADLVANVIKDRSGRYQGKPYRKPGVKLGKELATWLQDGEHPSRQWLRELIATETLQKCHSKWQAASNNGKIPESDFDWGMELLQQQASVHVENNGRAPFDPGKMPEEVPA